MTPRASATYEILFGPTPVFVKSYPVSSGDRPSPLSLVHAACGGKLEQILVCRADQSVVSRADAARSYRLPDGTDALLTEDELRRAESSSKDTIEVTACIPEDGLDPIALGKAAFLGPDAKRSVDAYATLVDALAETRCAAVGVLHKRTCDQLVLIHRYRERGLLLREVFHADEARSVDEIELPSSARATLMPGGFEAWLEAIDRRRGAALEISSHEDRYPLRLQNVAAERAAGVSDLVAARRTNLLREARAELATSARRDRTLLAADRSARVVGIEGDGTDGTASS